MRMRLHSPEEIKMSAEELRLAIAIDANDLTFKSYPLKINTHK